MHVSPSSRVTAGRRPRVSMLTGCDPTAVYMIQRLRQHELLDAVYRVVWQAQPTPKRPLVDRLRKLRPGTVLRRLDNALHEHRFEVMLRDMSRELFGRDEPPRIETTATVEARRINEPEFAEQLAQSRPEILLVNGAPLLKEPIYGLPALGTVNCHFGIAPAYRGSFTLFWPLYHRDYDNLGATLHYLTRGLDAGPIIGRAYPALEPGDREGTVMAKCARVATELVIDYLEAVHDGRVAGIPQPPTGHLYRKVDRTSIHDARLWLEHTLGLRALPRRPPRRELWVR
jgi:methionyl-tRNA formyltransferase